MHSMVAFPMARSISPTPTCPHLAGSDLQRQGKGGKKAVLHGKGEHDVLELAAMLSVGPWAELLLSPVSWNSGNDSLPDMMKEIRREPAGGLSRYNTGTSDVQDVRGW